MSRYDDPFDAVASVGSVFAAKGALDSLADPADPADVVPRPEQEQALATILTGVHEGNLLATVSIYGPPGTGKTLTTRRVCREFAARHDAVAVEYVNLKECRSIFSAANEILCELAGERKMAYAGLDGVFADIWDGLADYPRVDGPPVRRDRPRSPRRELRPQRVLLSLVARRGDTCAGE